MPGLSIAGSATPDRGVEAFLDAVAYKVSVESGARVSRFTGMLAIQYATELQHPWPREFAYRTEFFVYAIGAESVVDEIRRYFAGQDEEHVLCVFAPDPDPVIKAYAELRCEHAWTNVLMAAELGPGSQHRIENAAQVRPVRTPQDNDLLNAVTPEQPATRRSVEDQHLHGFVVEEGSRIVAKAQVVTKPGGIAYMADLFTEPDSRRRGLAGTLIEGLHDRVRAEGASKCILVPSLIAREIGLYEKYGYQELIPEILLIPRSVPS